MVATCLHFNFYYLNLVSQEYLLFWFNILYVITLNEITLLKFLPRKLSPPALEMNSRMLQKASRHLVVLVTMVSWSHNSQSANLIQFNFVKTHKYPHLYILWVARAESMICVYFLMSWNLLFFGKIPSANPLKVTSFWVKKFNSKISQNLEKKSVPRTRSHVCSKLNSSELIRILSCGFNHNHYFLTACIVTVSGWQQWNT